MRLLNNIHVLCFFPLFLFYLSFCNQLQSKSSHEELCPSLLGDPRQEPYTALHCKYILHFTMVNIADEEKKFTGGE